MPRNEKFKRNSISQSAERKVDDAPVVGPVDPRYFDLRFFPEPGPGQNAIAARLAQVAAIKARELDRGTVAYQIKARTGLADSSGVDVDEAASSGGSLRDIFHRLVPTKPYCGDEIKDGLIIRRREIALTKRHVQLNAPGLARWIVHDLDYPTGGTYAYRDANLPLPNVIVINRSNGHAHGLVLLETPVATHSGGRAAPLAFHSAVERGMARRLRADPGYAGLVAKNPLHDHWSVEWLRDRPFTLHELDEYLFPTDKRAYPSTRDTFGFGRNSSCFDAVREVAYREVLEAKRAGKSVEEFRLWLETVAQQFNLQFFRPLAGSEIRSIAKSIAKWTWRNFTPERLSTRQSERGKRGAAKRWAIGLPLKVSSRGLQRGYRAEPTIAVAGHGKPRIRAKI